jgi:hypothetical protein
MRGSFGIEEAVSDNLSDDFAGAAIVSFRAARPIAESCRTLFQIGVEELEVTLFGIAVLLGRSRRSESFALAFDEHHEFPRDFISFGNRQRAHVTEQSLFVYVELHLRASCGQTGKNRNAHMMAAKRKTVKLNMADYFHKYHNNVI